MASWTSSVFPTASITMLTMDWARATAALTFTRPAPLTAEFVIGDAVCSMICSTCAGVRLGFAARISAATPARLADAADVPKKSLSPPGTVVAILSRPETTTGLKSWGDDSRAPLLANNSSAPAPDDEKLSLNAGLTPNAGVEATLTAPAVITPGVSA